MIGMPRQTFVNCSMPVSSPAGALPQVREGWGEFFSANLIGDPVMTGRNKEYFTSTCQYFDEVMTEYLLDYYRQTL